jgi:hypothetical protein
MVDDYVRLKFTNISLTSYCLVKRVLVYSVVIELNLNIGLVQNGRYLVRLEFKNDILAPYCLVKSVFTLKLFNLI